MADTKLSNLPSSAEVVDADTMYVVDGGVSKNVPVSTLKKTYNGHVATLVALKAATWGVVGATVSLVGRTSTGDGGEGTFIFDPADLSTQVTNDALFGIYVPPDSDNTGASGAWVRQFSGAMNVKWFGALGDDSTDDTLGIQGALDYIDTLLPLAQTLYIPSGKYLVSTTLLVNSQGITIQGEGGNYFFQNAAQRNGTIIKWDGGADVVMRVTPNITSRPIIQPKLTSFGIDGMSLATRGLEIQACTQGIFEELSISHCTDRALHTGESALVGFTGLNFVHSCTFSNIGIDQVFNTDGDGIVLDGDNTTGASTTVCGFYEIHIRHYDGDGFTIARGDNNMCYKLSVGRPTAGSGKGIVFAATADTPSVNTNAMFYALGGEGGVHSMADDTINAVGNSIYGLSIDTDNPAPVIESGSTLFYQKLFDATDSTKTFEQNRIVFGGDYFNPVSFIGSHTYGINFVDGAYSSAQIRLKNNSIVGARNNADSGDLEVFRISTTDELTPGIDIRMPDGIDLAFSTTTGSKIGNSALQKIGFWGATAVVQPAANADTSGASLAALETEVNELKALLRTIGVMAI